MISAARLRRATRRETFGVDVGAALNLVGAVVKYLSLAFLFPAAVAVAYSESPWPFLLSGAVTGAAGWGLERGTRGKERVGVREGFLIVSLTWVLPAPSGALPYLLAEEQLSHPVAESRSTPDGRSSSSGRSTRPPRPPRRSATSALRSGSPARWDRSLRSPTPPRRS